MDKIVRKFFLVNNYEKEEKWLNEMSKQGFLLKKVSLGKYTFEKTDKHYQIRLVYMPEDANDFIAFLEETGASYVDSLNQWGYFSKEVSDDESFEIYNDLDSKIEQNERIFKFAGPVFIASLVGMILCFFTALQSDTLSIIFKVIVVTIVSSIILLYIYILLRLNKKISDLKKERELQE